MTKTFEFYWQDLTEECQKRLEEFLGEENGNYDVFPFATLEIEEDLDEGYFECFNCGKLIKREDPKQIQCKECQKKLNTKW